METSTSRSARATRRDARLIYNLIRSGVRREELIPRSLQAIEKSVDQFHVYEIDENIIACVTLVSYPDKPRLVEVGSLYVMPFYQNRGIGRKMVEFACFPRQGAGGRHSRRPIHAELQLFRDNLRVLRGRQVRSARGAAEALRREWAQRPHPRQAAIITLDIGGACALFIAACLYRGNNFGNR